MLAASADPNIADSDLDTALHLAAANGDQSMVESLLAVGAKACPPNRAGATPLFNAIVRSSLPVVKLLLPHHTDLQMASRGTVYSSFQSKSQALYPAGRSLMWVAANNDSDEIVQLLLYSGYDCCQEVWVDQNSALSPAVRDVLADCVCVPRSLMAMSRCVVRRALGPGNQRHVNQLRHIPRSIQNYISLRTI